MERPHVETVSVPATPEHSTQFNYAHKKAMEIENPIERAGAFVEAAKTLAMDGLPFEALEMAHEANLLDMIAGRNAVSAIVEGRTTETGLLTLEKTLEQFTASDHVRDTALELIAKKRAAMKTVN